jgi:phage gpG-like protein
MEPTMDIDFRQLERGFAQMTRAAGDFGRVWNTLGPLMKADQLAHHKLQVGPEGKWPGLAEETKRRKRGGGRRIFSKRMAAAFSIEKSRKELAAISNIPWASAHQDGDTVGRGVTLPKRPHIYMSKAFLEIALPAMLEHVRDAWLKGGRRR